MGLAFLIEALSVCIFRHVLISRHEFQFFITLTLLDIDTRTEVSLDVQLVDLLIEGASVNAELFSR